VRNETAELFEVTGETNCPRPLSLTTKPDRDVLAALMRTPIRNVLAGNLLRQFGSLTRVFGASIFDLERVEGMDQATASAIHACQVLYERVLHEKVGRRSVISSWTTLLAYLRMSMAGASREQFRVLFLDKKSALIVDEVMNHGTVDHAPVYPREVVRRALELSASAVILAHNHPTGDPTPSHADIEMTKQVIDACRPLGITVHDHVVIGVEGVTSLKQLALM
jgi:DNA repair protein RadC